MTATPPLRGLREGEEIDAPSRGLRQFGMQRGGELGGGLRRARTEAQQQQDVELQKLAGAAGRRLADRRLVEHFVDAAQRFDRLARDQDVVRARGHHPVRRLAGWSSTLSMPPSDSTDWRGTRM